ncbi:SUBTILISIN-LIKE PROTEASE SBT1.7 [Salix viminalis]|uniref:SUBTILISIN-LIKE PROTEASE SBT1.7 n=1 Tax=Salix viminalis TaxID=40686 RepID=A0A9Q0TMZ6_SALVM|nr:SUBTILISIN-LIKE PROTEASE SBT1.7 [Salix viminalis]
MRGQLLEDTRDGLLFTFGAIEPLVSTRCLCKAIYDSMWLRSLSISESVVLFISEIYSFWRPITDGPISQGFWRNSTYGMGVINGVLDAGISPDHVPFIHSLIKKCHLQQPNGKGNVISMELCALMQQIPFHQKLRQHLMMKQQLEIFYIMPMLGNANGTAVGMTPLGHLAICNVCSDFGCLDSDILAAMDAAVEDGMVRSAFLKIQWQWELFERLVQEFSWFVQQGMKDHIMVLYQPNSPPCMSLVYTGSHGSESAAFCAPESLSETRLFFVKEVAGQQEVTNGEGCR